MEGPFLPEGSGGEEPPEELDWAIDAKISAQMLRKERVFITAVGRQGGHGQSKRRRFSDYTVKNCEEARGERR